MLESHDPVQGLVSIVTPARNAEATLGETIASVLAQTYTLWEWIIVDDASEDHTAALVREAAAQDPRIRLLAVEGETGLAARARNRGMARARGAFIALLDADDTWAPEKLERQVNYLTLHPEADGVCTLYDILGDDERAVYLSRLLNHERGFIVRREEMLRHCPFQTSTILFRRRCYEETGGMDEDPRLRSGQDYEFFARLVHQYTIHRVPEPLTHYRVSTGQTSLSAAHLAAENERGWNIFTILQEKGIFTPEEAAQKRSMLYYEQAKNCLFHLHEPFRRHLFRSLRTGRPPIEAVVMVLLCWLPAPWLRPLLTTLLAWVNKRRSAT